MNDLDRMYAIKEATHCTAALPRMMRRVSFLPGSAGADLRPVSFLPGRPP